MYTRHEYKRYPVTLTYTCTKSDRKRMEYIGVCVRVQKAGRVSINTYTNTHV